MKKEGDIKRRYQHPDAVSYTPANKDGLMLLIKPSFSLLYEDLMPAALRSACVGGIDSASLCHTILIEMVSPQLLL